MSRLDPGHFILEGVMTTLRPEPRDEPAESRVNIAPMGPIVDAAFRTFLFRPFKSSTTYQNLKATGQGVFHVTDDALLIVRAAIGQIVPGPEIPVRPAAHVTGLVLADACRYYELTVASLDDRQERTTIRMTVAGEGRQRDFLGFNRARHAVLEAAILATRLHLTGAAPVLAELDRLQVIVDKTGDDREHQAMSELRAFVQGYAGGSR